MVSLACAALPCCADQGRVICRQRDDFDSIVHARCSRLRSRFDDLTRHSTRPTLHFIKSSRRRSRFRVREQAGSIIMAAADAGVPSRHAAPAAGLRAARSATDLIVEFSRYNREITDLDLEKRTSARRGCRSRSIERFSQTARLLFRPGCGHQLARDHRWDDRERFFRRARARLWDDGRPRRLARSSSWPTGASTDRSGPRDVGRAAANRSPDLCDACGRDRRMDAARIAEALDRLRHRTLSARAGRSERNALRRARERSRAIFSAELNIVPLPRDKGLGPDLLRFGRGSDAGHSRASRPETGRHRAHRPAACSTRPKDNCISNRRAT